MALQIETFFRWPRWAPCIELLSLDAQAQPVPSNAVVVDVDGQETTALRLRPFTSIKTSEKIDRIDLEFAETDKVEIEAVDANGAKVLGEVVPNAGSQALHYRLEGNGLHDTRIALAGSGNLLSLCVDGGPASLIDLCWASAIKDAQSGWSPVSGITQPIALPVRHPDYPASGNLATNLAGSRAEALSRIRYGDPNLWATAFDDIHEQCLHVVEGGPAVPMNAAARAVSFAPVVEAGDTVPPPTFPQQQPLDLMLLASLHAPIAQILGLYWSDTSAIEGEIYDYLVVADRNGAGHNAQQVLAVIQSTGFANVDGYIVFAKQIAPAAALAAPSDVRSLFSLIEGYLDGERMFSTIDKDLTSGRVGLYTSG